MTCSRRGLAAASSEGRIYVAGGWDGRKYLDSMAIYDTFTGKWANGPAMLCRRCFAAATFVGPHLYVVGGYYGATNLRSAERFDPVVCRNSCVFLYIYLVILILLSLYTCLQPVPDMEKLETVIGMEIRMNGQFRVLFKRAKGRFEKSPVMTNLGFFSKGGIDHSF